jgi:hypothetical protein
VPRAPARGANRCSLNPTELRALLVVAAGNGRVGERALRPGDAPEPVVGSVEAREEGPVPPWAWIGRRVGMDEGRVRQFGATWPERPVEMLHDL